MAARRPAAAVLHLLVGQHGHVDRIPVHHRLAAIDQAGLEKVEEQGLLLGVILGIAGRELAGPVERQAHGGQLLLHGGDVGVGPLAGMNAALHGGVLGRHAEGVPAHRVQDVESLGHFIPRHHVAHDVVAHMAHVDLPRGIGEHLQHVVLRLVGIDLRAEQVGLGPGLAPFRFGRAVIVTRGHSGPRRRSLRAPRDARPRRATVAIRLGRRTGVFNARRRAGLRPRVAAQPSSACRAATRSWRARVRMASSIRRGVASETSAEVHAPPWACSSR